MARLLLKLLITACLVAPLHLIASQQPEGKQCVILLHGLARTGSSMLAVQWRLSREGYVVQNVTYPSLNYPIKRLSYMAMDEGLAGCREQGAATVHVVTHSLGGILLRQYIMEHKIEEQGRVVMLGPPNQGSQLADYIQTQGFIAYLQPPAAKELGTGLTSTPSQLGAVNFELGVIAGTKNHRPFIGSIIYGPSDGTVAVEETKVKGMKDFLIVSATHTFMMWNYKVLNQIVAFLDKGIFERGE